MKNLKIRTKLIVSFGTLLLLSLVISVMTLNSIRTIQKGTDVIATSTLSNTECIWEMRRNLASSQRYALMAFAEEVISQIPDHLTIMAEDVERYKTLLQQCKQNDTIDQTKVQALETLFNQETLPREQMVSLLKQGTDEAARQAFIIFEEQYKPLQSEQGKLLMQIRDDQFAFAAQRNESAHDIYVGTQIFGVATAILLTLCCIFLALKLMQYIMLPLHEIQDATSALAAGDFSKELSYNSRDEFGETCQSIQTSFTELKRIISGITTNFAYMANGNFAFDGRANFPGEMAQIEQSGGVLLDKLNAFLHEIKSSADQIRAGSDQVASGAQSLAQGATEQASSIQELSASLSDVSNNVQTNAENSQKANTLAMTSGEVAQATLRDMQDMLEAMGKISMSSESIRKVIKVIDDITFQTNILSLNAAVEAARAGIAGKGFAVVADEVRNLAQKSSESAKEITALIESTIDSVNQGEQIAQKTSTAFNDLTVKIKEVVSTVNDIAIASQEQAETIQQITQGVDQISAVVQTNSATSEESAAASEQLSSQANVLTGLVGQFKLRPEVDLLAAHSMPATEASHAMPSMPSSSSVSPFDKY